MLTIQISSIHVITCKLSLALRKSQRLYTPMQLQAHLDNLRLNLPASLVDFTTLFESRADLIGKLPSWLE